MKEKPQAGLYLATHPKLHFMAIFPAGDGTLAGMEYALTPQLAAELGSTLLRLSAGPEAHACAPADIPATYRGLEVN